MGLLPLKLDVPEIPMAAGELLMARRERTTTPTPKTPTGSAAKGSLF